MLVFDFMSEEKRALLSAVAKIQLPIVIEGKVATGKSFVARYIHSQGIRRTYDLLEEADGYVSLEKLEEIVREKEDINNLTIVSYAGTKDVVSQLDEHIKVKCFHNPELNRRDIHIVLVKGDNVPQDELKVRLVRPVVLLRGFNEESTIERYKEEPELNVVKKLDTSEELDKVVGIIRSRIDELKTLGVQHYKEAGLPTRHFIHDLDIPNSHISLQQLEMFTRYGRFSGIYLTLFSRQSDYTNNVIEEMIGNK